MRLSRLAVLAVVVCASFAAAAADLPVTYTVQEKPLKAAIMGTPLTITLHRNASCADAPVFTMVANIEDLTFVSKLKLFTAKGDTKLPNTAELHHTLVGITATGNLFLKITGAGITPAGGVCQPQSAVVSPTLAAPALTKIIRYGLNHPRAWGVMIPTPELFDPSNLLATNANVENFLAGLNKTKDYSCSISVSSNSVAPNQIFGDFVPTFDLQNCVQQ